MNIDHTILLILIISEIFFLFFLSYNFLNNRNLIYTFFEPIIAFIFGSLIVYFIVPFFMIFWNLKFYKFENYSVLDYFYSNLMCFLYVILVIIFYFLFEKKILLNKNIKFNFNKLNKNELYFLIIFIGIPIIISTIFLIKNVYVFGLEKYLNNRIIIRKGKGILVLLSYLSLVLVPILSSNLFVKYLNKEIRNNYLFIFFLFIIVPFLFVYIILGNRLPAFIIINLSLFSYWIIYKRKLTKGYLIKIFFIFITLILLFSFAGLYRLSRGDFSKMDNKYLKNIYTTIFEYAIIKNFGNYEQLVWLNKYENRWEPLYGETYVAGFLNFIPRKIYPNKLLGGGPRLKNIISPGSYNLHKSNLTSYTTGVIVEAFMNFKYWGILIISFFHSLLLILLKKFSLRLNKNLILFNVYLYLLFSISFLILFSEFLGLFSKIVFIIIPFLIVYFFSKLKIYKLIFSLTI